MNYSIRKANLDDALDISSIIFFASPEGVGMEGTEEELTAWQEKNCSVDLIKSRINDPSHLVLVSQNDTRWDDSFLNATGYASISGNRGYIGGLYASCRDKGVGASIIRELCDWLQENKVITAEMIISANNPRMLHLARKMDFNSHGYVEGEIFVNGSWLVMKRYLI